MSGYICVYRHVIPDRNAWDKTHHAALSDPYLLKFLDNYKQNNCFFDWGDDPSFYAAQEFTGNVCNASWGVCRRNVRQRLKLGDLVIFFCAKPRILEFKAWDYYYIGFSTVRAKIDRNQLWTDDKFYCYRRFYNVLAKVRNGEFIQRETFHPYHPDWKERLKAAYILFERDKELSHFNLLNPLCVATYDGTRIPEKWLHSNAAVQLENSLFVERGIQRRLRSAPKGYGHTHINLTNQGKILRPGRTMEQLRKSLLDISVSQVTTK